MRLFGIPITVQPMFFVVAVMIGYQHDTLAVALWVAVVFVSILVHEFGHALVGRHYGLVPAIELYSMGGMARFENPSAVTISPRQKIAISLAGPFAGFLLGAVVLLFQQKPDTAGYLPLVVRDLLWVNLGWGMVNLLPIYPLDGGQVLEALLERWEKSAIIVRWVSVATLVAIAAAALIYRQPIMAIVALWFGYSNYQQIQQLQTFGEELPHYQALETIADQLEGGDASGAVEQLEQLLLRARSDHLRSGVLVLLAHAYLRVGDVGQADRVLAQIPPGQPVPPELTVGILLASGDIERALEVSREVARSAPELGLPLLVRALARAEKYREIIDTLQHERLDLQRELIDEFRRAAHLAHENGELQHAFAIDQLLFGRAGEATEAFNAGCELSLLGRHDEALDWLEKAVAAGITDRREYEDDDNLAALRDLPRFRALVRQLSPFG